MPILSLTGKIPWKSVSCNGQNKEVAIRSIHDLTDLIVIPSSPSLLLILRGSARKKFVFHSRKLPPPPHFDYVASYDHMQTKYFNSEDRTTTYDVGSLVLEMHVIDVTFGVYKQNMNAGRL